MIKGIKSNKIFLSVVFCLILLIATVFRLACLNKIDGLWYDELVMYNQAVQSSLKEVILYALVDDVHLPLYQVLLHYWAKLFSFSDFSLRSFSAVCGILAVVFSFFIGKTIKSNFVGFILMGLFAINSFLIYYSQEVRMYELLAMFSTLNLLCCANIYKENAKKIWYLFWIVSTTGLILTYTISILYVMIQVVFLLFFKRKEFVIPTVILIVLNLPIIFYLILFKEKFANFVTGFYSDWSSLFVVLQNFFTPKLVGVSNNPIHYIQQFVQNFKFVDFIFVVIPIVIAIYFITKAMRNEKIARFIFAFAGLFLLAEIVAFIFTDFKILSRYLIIILPNMLTLIALGAKDYKNKLSIILISSLLLISFAYLVYSPRASYKLGREGYLPIVKMLKDNKIQDNDIVFVWNRKEVLSKYLDKKITVLSVLKDIAYKSEYVFANQDKLNKSTSEIKKDILKDYFASKTPAKNTEILMAFVISHMKPEQKIMLVTNGYFEGFNQEEFYKQIQNDKTFSEFTFNNLMTIKAILDLKYICNHSLTYVGSYKKGFYVLQVWKK